MTESKAKADLIWNKLFSISNEDKSREEQIAMIEAVLNEMVIEQRNLGRAQVLNHIQGELDHLKYK